jgi:hypothetical protein
MSRRVWTPKEDEFLIENHLYSTLSQMACELRTSVHTVQRRLNKLRKLNIIDPSLKQIVRPWTTREVEYLLQFHGTASFKELALALDRTYASVRSRYYYEKSLRELKV